MTPCGPKLRQTPAESAGFRAAFPDRAVGRSQITLETMPPGS